MTPASLSAIVLAGGQSSRMGQDKALIPINGVPLLRQVCDAAVQCTPIVLVVTPWIDRYRNILPDTCHLVQEHPLPHDTKPHGPLVGFAQGLAQVQTEWALLLACDLPRLSIETIQGWIRTLPDVETAIALSPKTQKGWDPLCGFYRTNCLPRLTAAINRGSRSFQDWLSHESIQELPIDERAMLFNCNTPADLAKLNDQD